MGNLQHLTDQWSNFITHSVRQGPTFIFTGLALLCYGPAKKNHAMDRSVSAGSSLDVQLHCSPALNLGDISVALLLCAH